MTITPVCMRCITYSVSCCILARSTPRCAARASLSLARRASPYARRAVRKNVAPNRPACVKLASRAALLIHKITLLAKYGEGADGGVEHGHAAAHEHAAAREQDEQQGAEAAADAAARICEQDDTDDVDQGLCILLYVEAGRASVQGDDEQLGGH